MAVGTDGSYFDYNSGSGLYTPHFDDQSTLTYNSGAHTFLKERQLCGCTMGL